MNCCMHTFIRVSTSVLMIAFLGGCIIGGSESTSALQPNEFDVRPRINYDVTTGEGWIYFDLLLTEEFQQTSDARVVGADLGGSDRIVVTSGSQTYVFSSEVDGVLGGFIRVENPAEIIIEYQRNSSVISKLVIDNDNGVFPSLQSDLDFLDNNNNATPVTVDFDLSPPFELPMFSSAGITGRPLRCYREDRGFEQVSYPNLLEEFVGFRYQDLGKLLNTETLNPIASAGFASESFSSGLARGTYQFCDTELRAQFSSGGSSESLLDNDALMSFEHNGLPSMKFVISTTSSPVNVRVDRSAL